MMSNKPKLLIVDDEPNNHRVLVRILEPLSLDCVSVHSGQQALGLAHREDFFLILMDVQMPEMDGFETALLIFDHPKTSHIPIIFLTAFARDEAFEFKGYDSGAVDYLIKPINDEILKSKVDVFLTLYQERKRLKKALEAQIKAEQELHKHKENLEDLVLLRTQELKQSLQQQISIEKQLIESEKMASLGRLVAGISHELNTPIGVSLTASSYLQEETAELNRAFLDGSMSKRCFVDYIECADKTTEILSSNLKRAKALIKNFKQVTVDVSSEMPRSFNLMDYIRTVIQSLEPETKRNNPNIVVEGDAILEVETFPGSISQILTNLIMNSLLHAYDEHEQANIVILVERNDEKVRLTYRDDGKGMHPEIVEKIFEPFFTTRRGSGGSGLGMHILYNLVTQTLGGQVICDSEPGKGTSFHMLLPIKIVGTN